MSDQSNVGAALAAVEKLMKAEILTLEHEGKKILAADIPSSGGRSVVSVKKLFDDYLKRPERRKGAAQLTDLESFIAHANRFKNEDSALFAQSDPKHPLLMVVFNYHPKGPQSIENPADWGDHRGVYTFQLSDEWTKWTEVAEGEALSQSEFAEFLEDRIADVADPATALASATAYADQLGVSYATAAKLMELSRGIAINVDAKLSVQQNLSSGEALLHFSEDHKDSTGAPLRIPRAFLIQIPVFKFGAVYQIPVRLRYRKVGASVVWAFAPARLDQVFQDAFKDACDKANADTQLPLYYGKPE